MRRFILPVSAILLSAACGAAPGHTTSSQAEPSSHAATKASESRSNPAAVKSTSKPESTPKPKASAKAAAKKKTCEPTRDVLVWYKTPGLPNSAQRLGNYYLATCESTFEWLQKTAVTEPGACTEAAWASDNPGYNTDATPAARLKKVQMAAGPGC
ncbi:hypothetical protein [Streptomyces arenae]|uniref:hypothetical protein n=1 Tax=Streptomyces arenae TaxID=29301 RepID=UPI002659473D|nr:hypothetical protein [Streptomyces arenae]MCG7203885.1 hypothetical protein [Streptomyces arenae]